MVGIDPVHLRSYPHQLSGGMRQRPMIAMALLFTPDLVIMDEPTSALDVVAQRSLMVQIKELQQAIGFAVIFVTHDMSLVSHFSDRLMVMYAGQVAELGATRAVFDGPLHPYTQGLLEAFPSIRGPKVPLKGIPGSPPDLAVVPNGCRFHPAARWRSTGARGRARAVRAGRRARPLPAVRRRRCRQRFARTDGRQGRCLTILTGAAPGRAPDQALQDRRRARPAARCTPWTT